MMQANHNNQFYARTGAHITAPAYCGDQVLGVRTTKVILVYHLLLTPVSPCEMSCL
jgi:hypothetical protein